MRGNQKSLLEICPLQVLYICLEGFGLAICEREEFKTVMISAPVSQYGPDIPRLRHAGESEGQGRDFAQAQFLRKQNTDARFGYISAMSIQPSLFSP